jgi:hypothetical protein
MGLPQGLLQDQMQDQQLLAPRVQQLAVVWAPQHLHCLRSTMQQSHQTLQSHQQ